jgi:hypothetical protein
MIVIDPILGSTVASRQHGIIIYAAVFMSLSVSVVAARLFVRIHMLKVIGPDDWAIVVSLVS